MNLKRSDCMLESLMAILGEYTPVTTTYETILNDGTIHTYEAVAQGVAGVDWPWVSGALLLIVVIFCIFKMLGGIFRG